MNSEEAKTWYGRTLMDITMQAIDNDVEMTFVLGELAMAQHIVMASGTQSAIEEVAAMTPEERKRRMKEVFGSGSNN